MLTTRRRFASARRFLASSSPSAILLARSTSSSAVRSGTLPISFRYMRTGSSMLIPSGTDRSSFSMSTSSSSEIMRSTSSISSSSPLMRSTSMLCDSRYSNTFSMWSGSSSISEKKSLISCTSRILFFFFPRETRSFNFSSNFTMFSSI